MLVTTDYCAPTSMDSHVEQDDASATCFYHFPVKSVEAACNKLLNQDSIRVRCQALAARVSRIKTKGTYYCCRKESVERNLKIAAYVAAAVTVVILINAATVGLLTALVLSFGVSSTVVPVFEIGTMLVPASIVSSMYAAHGIWLGIYNLSRPAPPIFREENLNSQRRSVSVKLLGGIEELHKKLLKIVEKDVNHLSQEDISTLFHILKEVKDLSALASGNNVYEEAKKSLIQYLQKNEKVQLEDKKTILDKIKDYAFMKDKERLEHMICALNRRTDSDEETPIDYLDEIAEIIMAYRGEKGIHADIEALILDLRSTLLRLLDKENKALLQQFTEQTKLDALNGDDNRITLVNTANDVNEINLYDLVDKLHTVEELHQLLSVLITCRGSCTTVVEKDPATDASTGMVASPESEIPFSATANKPGSHPPRQVQALSAFDTRNDLFKINRIYRSLREKLLKLADRDDKAAGCSSTRRVWAMRSITRRIKHFWEDRKYPVKLSTIETNEDTYISPLYCIPFDEVASTPRTADNIVLLLKDGRLYAHDELARWAAQKRCDAGLLISPFTRGTVHILDMCPLSAMIPAKAFTLKAFLPQALPVALHRAIST